MRKEQFRIGDSIIYVCRVLLLLSGIIFLTFGNYILQFRLLYYKFRKIRLNLHISRLRNEIRIKDTSCEHRGN